MSDQSISHSADVPFTFQCNICDKANECVLQQLTREDPTCSHCGSSVRLRSIIQILTTELFGRSLRISEIVPRHKEIIGIGMSCAEAYAIPLAQHLGYTNTFYHQPPLLDITDIDVAMEGTLDFIISTDVFEHIEPPVSRAFINARKLLKTDGVLIFSVPFSHPGENDVPAAEHFPDLYEYAIEKSGNQYRLKNTTRQGDVQYFDDLIFHGGAGSTLEMRLFSEASLISELTAAGFAEIEICSGSDLRHGIYWPYNWSLPMVARASKQNTKTFPSVRNKVRSEAKTYNAASFRVLIRQIIRKILRRG